MRGVPAWHQQRSGQHPSTVLALRANPPSPTGRALHGERSGVRWSVGAFLKAGRAVFRGPCGAFVGLGSHPAGLWTHSSLMSASHRVDRGRQSWCADCKRRRPV
ncbi:hypothetical protein EOB36_04975, partial [Mesorhizobium sp. M6A.T.Cr.TU.017.01.1.1]